MNTDQIEKKVILHAPLARLWRVLTDHSEFRNWFGVAFDGPFAPGAGMRGRIVGTRVDAEVAREQKKFEHIPFEFTVEQMVPERLFSFRWHPSAVEPGVDYSAEPTTLVAFALEEAPGGVALTITESGLDRIPLARREKAFAGNDAGWAIMSRLIEAYVAQHGD